MIFKKLTNIPLKNGKTGVVKGERCNLITLYCPFCGRFHILERKDIVHVNAGNNEFLCCYESVKDLVNND